MPDGFVDTVIGVIDAPIDQRTMDSWPLAAWGERGVQVRFYQCNEILLSHCDPAVLFPEHVTEFASAADLNAALRNLAPDSTFVLFFLHKYGPREHSVIRTAERVGLRYAFLLSDEGDLPQPDFTEFLRLHHGGPPLSELSVLRKLRRIGGRTLRFLRDRTVRIAAALIAPLKFIREHRSRPIDALDYLYQTLHTRLRGHGALRGPDFWTAKGRGSIDFYYPQSFPVGVKTRILWTHVFMYDAILAQASQSVAPAATAVFAGQYAPLLRLPGYVNTITPENYYGALQKLFDYIRNELKLEVVKTTHPWGDIDELRARLHDVRFERGKSLPFIREAQLTIGHCTTALFFAIYYRKPILFITTDELERMSDYGPYTAAWARELGRSVVNLDHVEPADIDWSAALSVDEDVYNRFIQRYIKTPGSPQRPVWDCIYDAIQRTGTTAEPARERT